VLASSNNQAARAAWFVFSATNIHLEIFFWCKIRSKSIQE